MSQKINPTHLERKALLYIRQSSTYQVCHNTESQNLQYAMKERLVQLGWKTVDVIDEDLGRSASGSVDRPGFQRLVTEISLGRVGAVAAREVSRFARNSRDWQQLVEVCRMVDTLLVDLETIYDPRSSNDRLLLGLKGSLNEYELDLLRQRAHEARRHKAARGELFTPPSVGFVKAEGGGYVKDPNLRVQSAISLVFGKFLDLGSVRQALFWFKEHDVNLPVRVHELGSWKIQWKVPRYCMLYRILTHPLYGGAYVYGRTQTRLEFKDGKPHSSTRTRPRDQWLALIPDQHEGYISWDEFERIQTMIHENANRPNQENKGAVKKGAALLVGLLRCRRCGRKLLTHYSGRAGNVLRYNCRRGALDNAQPRCINFGGAKVDDAVSAEVLNVCPPAAIRASLEAAQSATQVENQAMDMLNGELEAAQYDAKRAFKQYDQTDPENRLVALELERRWNDALERVQQVEERIATEKQSQRNPPPPAESLEDLDQDLHRIWDAPSTDVRLKKRIIRTLVEEVVVDVDSEHGKILLTIHWKGGVHTELNIPRRRRGSNRLHTDSSIIESIRQLALISHDRVIAGYLNRNGHKTGHGMNWTVERVAAARSRHKIPKFSEKAKEQGWLTLTAAAKYLGISTTTLRKSIVKKTIKGLHPLNDGPWIINTSDLNTPEALAVKMAAQKRSGKGTEPDTDQLVLLKSTTYPDDVV
jgi:DNA invertase Pin-like site-specific DNA recombinase